jgi:hypothetical protein
MANLNLVAQSNYVAVPSLQNSNNFGQYGYGNMMQQGGFPNQNYGGLVSRKPWDGACKVSGVPKHARYIPAER